VSETTEAESAIVDAEAIGFRRLSYADLPAVLSIERRSFPAPWSLAMFVLEVSKPSGVCLAAIAGEEIVGYLVCSRYADVFHLMNVAVDPDLRRRGIAVRMIERMLDEAGRHERYTLEVRVSNHPAIAMYERLGFRRAGRRRRYYSDNGEDAMIMWFGDAGP
jgi:ribosomal-protein-alanine N-acetyltransferase